jgi:hypothetical protein
MNDARTKIIFGDLDYDDLQIFANNLLLEHYSPVAIKHIQRTPVFAPVESVRKVPTVSTSSALNRSVTESLSEADSRNHSVEHSIAQGHSVADSLQETQGEQESYTHGRNSSRTHSSDWGASAAYNTATTRSRAHTDGLAVGHGRGRGRTISDGTTDSTGQNTASGASEGHSSTDSSGRSSSAGRSQNSGLTTTASTGEGQVMLPQEEEGIFDFLYPDEEPVVLTTSKHMGAAEARNSSAGSSQMEGASSGHSDSRMRGTNSMVGSSTAHARSRGVSDTKNESDSTTRSNADTVGVAETEGWNTGVHESHGTAEQTGENEAWGAATNRSTTRGNSVTHSAQVSEGYSDTVGRTDTRGIAFTQGETLTHGESYTMTPFYEYVREEIKTPVFLTPEEQKLLVMQKLKHIRQQHFLIKAPESPACIVRAPHVPDPFISTRRRDAGLESVYAALPFYTRVTQLASGTGRDEHSARIVHRQHDGADSMETVEDVIYVEAEEVHTPERNAALLSCRCTSRR